MKLKPAIGITLLSLLFLLIISAWGGSHTDKENSSGSPKEFTCYSNTVKDTFYIPVQLPLNYEKEPKKRYPVVVSTDANFYFPMLAPIMHQYEKGGLLPRMVGRLIFRLLCFKSTDLLL